jgi:hypothetical protein
MENVGAAVFQGCFARCICDEIKGRLNFGSVCLHCSVQSVLYSFPISENAKIKINGTIILPAVLYCNEILLPFARKQHIVRLKKAKKNI